MNHNKRALVYTLALAFIFSTFTASGNDLPKGAKKAADILKKNQVALDRAFDPMNIKKNPGLLTGVTICQGFFTVQDDENLDGPPHLEPGHVLVLNGPIPWNLEYQVTPVSGLGGGPWNHPWQNHHYTATPDPYDPDNWFDMRQVSVEPHDGGTAVNHEYRMQITDRDGDDCPTYVIFYFVAHEDDGIVPLHPGHAGASVD